jgi:hypothetical protein
MHRITLIFPNSSHPSLLIRVKKFFHLKHENIKEKATSIITREDDDDIKGALWHIDYKLKFQTKKKLLPCHSL